MDFKALEQIINDTATQNKIDKATIINDLADILKIKYGISIMEKERDFIDEVKNKIITKLYNYEDHKISADKNLQKTFKLDALENDYLDAALNELQHEGLIIVVKSDFSLTKQGIMKFKEFYGEI